MLGGAKREAQELADALARLHAVQQRSSVLHAAYGLLNGYTLR